MAFERENDVKHPSYGMIGFSRISGGNPKLYGSSVPHNEKIMMTLKHGYYNRDLNQEWYFGKGTIAEVEMSYTQFAEAIASMNVGDGVPCTLTYTEKDGNIPPCDFELSKEKYEKEFASQIHGANKEVDDVTNYLIELFKKPRITKAEKEEVLSKLRHASMNMGVNAQYVLSAFNEHLEKSVLEAKNEVEAFTQRKINSLGLQAVKENISGSELEEISAQTLIEKKES